MEKMGILGLFVNDVQEGEAMIQDFSRSHEAFQRACQVIPGGVSSPVRSFSSVGMKPIVYASARGKEVIDLDNNRYLDFIGSWGPMILGHAYPAMIEAVSEALERGTSFGAPCVQETLLAEEICALVPQVERVRFVSSGTEATMSALRLARGVTRRDKIIKFEGNYHGHSDALLVKAGSGVASCRIPGTPGVSQAAVQDTLLACYNDLESVAALFKQYPQDIAALIVEPVAGNMGVVAPQKGFLEGLRELCDRYGTLLIFDEVITGFRLALGGAQEKFGVNADLVCFGKIIGGGFPVGAFAGRADIMEQLAPLGEVYQAGTLSGNPIAMTAGYVVLRALQEDGLYDQLEERGKELELLVQASIQKLKAPCSFNRVGSLATLFFTREPVVDYQTALLSDTQAFSQYFSYLTRHGFLIAPSQFEALFISMLHTKEDIERLGLTIEAALTELYGG